MRNEEKEEQQPQNTLVPALRFPEFQDAGEWEEKTLGEVCLSISSGKDQNDPNGTYNLYGSTGIIGKTANNTFSGDYILVARVGANAGLLTRAKGEFGVTDNTLLIDLIKSEDTNFIYYLLDQFGLNRLIFGSGQPLITAGQLKKLIFGFPSLPEQRKIADCLSSLDEWITAESEKLEALKAHKKGLMQRLFPAQGETVPRLRFPEFQDAGEWEEKTLGECLLQNPEYGINAPAVPYSHKLPTYLRITDISEDGQFLSNEKVSVNKPVTEDNYLQEGDIVLARTGASVGKSYKYRNKDGKLVFAGFLIRVRTNQSKLDSEYLIQYLHTNQYWKWVNFISMRSGQPGINGTEYASMPIILPLTIAEQQKIADCLSSLDELITAQSEQITLLKLHKKGLMQRLFPVG